MICTFSVIVFILVLLLNRQGKILYKDPLSAIGNIGKNYPVFVIGSVITFIFFTYILYSVYKKNELKVNWEVFSIPILGITSMIVPFNENNFILKKIHTILALFTAIMIIKVMYNFNKNHKTNKQITKKINVITQRLAIFGTLLLFLISGVNTLVQIFYLLIVFFWINNVSFNH